MKHFNLLIKPASSACNMACRYCFYKDESQKRKIADYGMMSEEVMDHVIKKALDYAEESCTFGFQGGEPTLAGLQFFQTFTDRVERYKKKHLTVSYSFQTNGILIDDEWMKFFAEKKFLVGISLDGPKAIHDANRLDGNGKTTFDRVTRAIQGLLKHRVDVNVLVVLTRQSARHVEKVYSFLKKLGVRYHQYIPCLDPLGQAQGKEFYSLTPKLFAQAHKNLFDLWFADWMRNDYVSIRQFENWVGVLKGYSPEACTMYGICTMQNVIEANGDVFPCDFYVLDEYRVANIKEQNFFQLYEKLEENRFFQNADRRDYRCPNCRWYPICRGGCRRDCVRIEQEQHNYYCEAYQEIFSYIIERLEYLASR